MVSKIRKALTPMRRPLALTFALTTTLLLAAAMPAPAADEYLHLGTLNAPDPGVFDTLVVRASSPFRTTGQNKLFGRDTLNRLSLLIKVGTLEIGKATFTDNQANTLAWELKVGLSDLKAKAGSLAGLKELIKNINEQKFSVVLSDGDTEFTLME